LPACCFQDDWHKPVHAGPQVGAIEVCQQIIKKKERVMEWLVDLFSTDHGLFNTGVIVFMLGMRVGCNASSVARWTRLSACSVEATVVLPTPPQDLSVCWA